MTKIGELKSWNGGISSTSKKTGPANSFAYGIGIDFRSEPSELGIQPRSVKISGSIVTDLPMWMDSAGDNLYAHGNTGNIYKLDSSDNIIKEYTVPNSQGNGLAYFPEDKYLYIPTRTSISRRSTATTTGEYFDTFLESGGGAPTNTYALSLVAASSQSATHIDDASLSITGDLTFETYLKPTSLPTGSNKMSIISKWDESGTLRSYKLDIIPTSAAFGDGSDSALVVSASATETVIDANCTGTSGTNTLTISNVTGSFAVGQKVLIHQSRGSGVGQKQINEIIGIVGSVLTFADNLTFSPSHSATTTDSDKAQVRVLKQYTNVTVNTGITWSAKAWDGLKGGILAFLANGTVTVTGSINASAVGFAGSQVPPFNPGNQAEGTGGSPIINTATANGNGGGGAVNSQGGGGAGGNGTAGANGGGSGGQGGVISGSSDLTTLTFGGGGGSGGSVSGSQATGGNGGGIILIIGATLVVTGSILSNGSNGGAPARNDAGGGGAGAGGSILLRAQTATLGASLPSAIGGTGGAGQGSGLAGGNGGDGRIHLDYYTSFTGTTTPTLNSTQDDSLGIANGYALRLYISSTGLNSETYTQNIDNPQGFYHFFSVSWKASTSTAKFYQNGQLIGTKMGSLTAIHDNATEFAIGCSKNDSGTRSSFYDGLLDDTRIFNAVRTDADILNNYNKILTGSEAGLVAYYKFDNNLTDSQSSVNNSLTGNNTPTFSIDVAFKGVTTRNDEDVSIAATGQLYTLTTALNEGATHRQTFSPTKEPLKSIALNIDTVGTGNWTVVIHDEQNNVLTSLTVTTANLHTGIYEFIFASSVRPVLNASYHVHVYSTVADGKIVTSVVSDMESAYLKTYFQILVDDQFHPAKQFLNFIAIGNERYLAILEAGSLYQPHRLILPSGYRIRCLAYWGIYLAIGTWKGNAVTDTDQAKVFFWDGTADTYIDPLDVPTGAINAMFGEQGTLTIVAGYKGKVLEYTGGAKAAIKFQLPQKATTDYAEIAPGAMTMWDSMTRLGATFNTNSTTIHQGIYSYGQKDDSQPMSLGFDHPLSIGDQQTNTVKIGSLFPRGQKLYAGFQNGNTFGIDVIDPNADPYPTATIELLLSDLGSVPAPKYPLVFRSDFEPLTTGQSIIVKYKPDRATNWQILKTQNIAGATAIRTTIAQRIKELQFAVDIVTNGSRTAITSMTLESDDAQGGGRV